MSLNPRIETWKDKRVWIVGASTGIGAALADALLAKGARVAVSARRREPLEAIAAKFGANVAVLPLDINDSAELERSTNAIVARWGGVDVVVCMAGDYKPMRAWELDLEVARRMIQTNIQGYLNVLAPVIPLMMKQGSGAISLVSSVAGFRGLPQSLSTGRRRRRSSTSPRRCSWTCATATSA